MALGWVFAWAILDFVNIFSAPISSWISRSEFRRMEVTGMNPIPAGLFVRDALPNVVSSFALFLIGFLFLRWLYFKPMPESAQSFPTTSEQ